MELYLVKVCVIAMIVVMTLLGLLAAAIHLITIALPVRKKETDSALVAAIGASVAQHFKGARVTRIDEEQRKR